MGHGPHLGVDRGEYIVEQVDVGSLVACAREGDSRLLAATQRDTALADLGPISRGQRGQICTQRACVEHLVGVRVRGRDRGRGWG